MLQKVLYVNKSTGVKPALKTEEEMYYKWQHETWIVWAGTGEYWNGLGRKRHGTICISVGRQAPEMQCGVSGTGSAFDGQDRQYRITIKRFYNKWWGSEAERLSYTQHLLLLGKKSRA